MSTDDLNTIHHAFHTQCINVSDAINDLSYYDADDGDAYEAAQDILEIERAELATRHAAFVEAMGERPLRRCCVTAQERYQLVVTQ